MTQSLHISPQLRLFRRKRDDDQRTRNGEADADEITGSWALSLDCPQPEKRRSNVDPAVRSIRSTRKNRIDARQSKGESTKADDSEERNRRRLRSPQPCPKSEAPGNFQKCCNDECDDVADHDSIGAPQMAVTS